MAVVRLCLISNVGARIQFYLIISGRIHLPTNKYHFKSIQINVG